MCGGYPSFFSMSTDLAGFLSLIPPRYLQSSPFSTSSTESQFYVPESFTGWDGFHDAVLHEPVPATQVDYPSLYPFQAHTDVLCGSEQALHSCSQISLGQGIQILGKDLGRFNVGQAGCVMVGSRGEFFSGVHGLPDLVLAHLPTADISHGIQEVVVVGEHKTLATFADHGHNSVAQLIIAYSTPGRTGGYSAVKKAIGQVLRYMDLNDCRYGFITTYDAVYFLRRTTVSHLEISEPVYLQQQSPTLLKSFYYILRLALLSGPPPQPSIAIAVQDTLGASTSGDVYETKRKTRSATQRERSIKKKRRDKSVHG